MGSTDRVRWRFGVDQVTAMEGLGGRRTFPEAGLLIQAPSAGDFKERKLWLVPHAVDLMGESSPWESHGRMCQRTLAQCNENYIIGVAACLRV